MARSRFIVLVILLLSFATVAGANNFRAADLVYMNAAGRVQGAAFFKTDVFITNVSSASVIVDVVYLPTGPTANYSDDSTWTIETLPAIAAGATVELEDIIGDTFGLSSGFGHLLFFSCRDGGDCSNCGDDAADCLPITVEGRVYAEATGAACPNGASLCTLGQLFSGMPWYSFVSRDVADRGLDKVKILGIRQFGGISPNRNGFRSNIGLVNSSAFSSTTLKVTLFNENNTQFGSTTRTLGPLAHTQENISSLFAGFTGTGYVIVEQTAVSPVDTSDPDCPDGCPGFYAYGSTLDNTSDDPTTLESVFLKDLTEFISLKKPSTLKRPVHRPAWLNHGAGSNR